MYPHQPASVYPIAFQTPMIIVYIMVILYPKGPSYNYCFRISSTFFAGSALMIAMPFLASIGSVDVNFWACFVAIGLVGMTIGLNSVTLFTLAAELRSGYMAAFLFGQGLGGILLNSLRVYTLVEWPANEANKGFFISTLVFYMTTAIFLATCGVAHLFQNDKI
jgi:hypothetical protein